MTTRHPFDELCVEVEAAMGRHKVPGVALGVLYHGEAVTAGFGVTSVEHPRAVDGDTLFQVASNTKTLTGTAALRLVEEGRLELDAPLRRVLPDLRMADPEVAARVTLRHTLQHTGGWVGDFAPDTGRGDNALARLVARMPEAEQLTSLGSVWSYNNSGFCLAGRAVEVASGQPYEDALERLVLAPLGMETATFFADDAITRGAAVGHNVIEDVPRVVRPWCFPRSINPVGGLIASARDMLRWGAFAVGDGRPLLRTETLRDAQRPQVAASSMADAVGLAWLISEIGGQRIVGHGGFAPGQMSAFRTVPAQGFAVVVLTNSDHGARLHGEVTAAALRLYLGLVAPPPRLVDGPARLDDLLGTYAAPLADLELRLVDGTPTLRVVRQSFLTAAAPPREVPPPTRLGFTGVDRLLALDPPQAGTTGDILRGADGRVAWLRWGGRIHRRIGDGASRDAVRGGT